MERNREARRGAMPAVNGGLSRRRQRGSGGGLRDSPEEDGGGGGMEMQEGTRLRSKKERERERSGRVKRRKVVMHGGGGGGGGRDEGDDSSEESLDDDDEDDYEEPSSVGVPAVRLPSQPPVPAGNNSNSNSNGSNNNNSSALLQQQQNQSSSSPNHHHHHNHHLQQQQQLLLLQHGQNHHRKGLAPTVAKAPRAPGGVWKAAADEMIGVSVPRKARTGSGGGGVGGGGAGETVNRQPSTSPARPSPSSSAPISPSSSNASVRKKLKPSSGNKHRPPKISKPQPNSVQDIEFEVAEVLFGMTRQFPGPPKPDAHKPESKEASNGSGGGEAKPRIDSPHSVSASPLLTLHGSAPLPGVVALKRKRPRPMKLEESPVGPLNQAVPAPPVSPSAKIDDEQNARVDLPSAKSEKISPLGVENGVPTPHELRLLQEAAAAPADVLKEVVFKMEADSVPESKPTMHEVVVPDQAEVKEEPGKAVHLAGDMEHDDASDKKVSPAVESPGKEKYEIDLMAPPPGKSSGEEAVEELAIDHKVMVREETVKKDETAKLEGERKDNIPKLDLGGPVPELKVESKTSVEELESRKLLMKERSFDLQLEISKQDKDEMSTSRQQQQPQKHPQLSLAQQQPKPPRTDLKPEKSVQPGTSPLPMNVPAWHGGLPTPFGYMGQVPSLVPMDGSGGPAKPLQASHVLVPPQRPKRCATHCYIAQCIQYNQQVQQLSRFWPAAAGATAFYGAKPPQYNVNGLQPSDSVAVVGSSLQSGGFPGRNLGSLQEMGSPAIATAFGAHPAKDKNPVAANASLDSSQRKQLVLQQPPQGVSANNILTPAAFVFPFNQPPAAAAASLSRPGGGVKSGNGINAATPSTSAPVVSPTIPASGAPTMNFNYANLPPGEPSYVAILQNNGYPFPIPAAHVGALPQFRGNGAQAMPFFSSSFYHSQMLHPAQLQQQPQQQQQQSQQTTTVPGGQQGHQNKSTSSGSSSSQKHQQQRVPGSVSGAPLSHGFPTTKPPQHLPMGSRPSEVETVSEDTPSSADSRVPSSTHKGIYSHNFPMPVHPQNFALMPSTDKQTHMPPSSQSGHSQAFTVSFPSHNGVTPPLGIDFSSVSQNHPLFQNIPEAARQNYQMVAVAAATSQAAQQKKSEGKTATETAEDERKAILTTVKAPVNFSQHSLAFGASTSPPLSNTAMEIPSRTLNLIHPPPSSSGRNSNRPASAAPSSASAGAASSFGSQQQQMQQMQQQQLQQQQSHFHQQIQRHQQQQQIMMQQQLVSRPKTSATTTSSPVMYPVDRASTAVIPKFPNPLGGFSPSVVVQGGTAAAAVAAAAASQTNQWKNASRSTQVPIHSQSQPAISSSKNQITQQQGRAVTQASPLPNQTQISFSVAAGAGSSQKLPPQSVQQMAGGNSTSNPSAQPSASKGSGGGSSPRSSAIGKQGPPHSATLPIQQPQQSKSSPANSSHKSSPVSSRNAPSILGQPHINNTQMQGTVTKQQMDQMQQHFQQPYYFNTLYNPPPAQTNPMAQGYLHRQQQQQQSPSQQHPNSTSSSTGVLSLCSPALTLGSATATTDPGKSSTATSMKSTPQNLLQAAAVQRPLMSAPGYSYVHAVSSVSVKPTEQKPATGNDNLHPCWQPEKR